MFTNVTLLYFLLLIPLSGFIAWLGDRIGHKSGKRRHTLFGLRPRHTAMVFTIGTGMCISFVSFALMWVFSESFRIVVRDGVRLYETNRQYKSDNGHLLANNGRLHREVTQRRNEAETAYSLRNEAVAEQEQAAVQRNEAIRQEKEAQEKVQRAISQIRQEKERLASAEISLREKQSALTEVQGTLKTRSVQLKQAEGRVAAAAKQVTDATQRVATATTKAADAEAKLAAVRRSAQEALDDQSLALASLHRQLDDEKTLFADQKAKIDAQRIALADLDSQVEVGRRELAQIQTSRQALREHQITYQVGEEVDRIEIKPGYNVWRIEAILQSFMTTAAKKAETRGARRDKTADRAIVIPPKAVESSGTDASASNSVKSAHDETTRVLTEDDAVRYAAESIRRANTDILVQVNAMANAVAGEPVAVDFKLYKNPVVFPAETQIGDIHVNGDGSSQQIADAVFGFLRQNVRTTLLQAGIIPQSHGGGDDTAGTIVNLSGEEWIDLMDRIRQAGPRARIVITAGRDIRAGDSLDDALHFDVKGIQNTAFRNPN